MDQTVHDKINDLTRRISELARRQTDISQQLVVLIDELETLKKEVAVPEEAPVTVEAPRPVETPQVMAAPAYPPAPEPIQPASSSYEEFIGKNLASKVGILVTIIGIFIGAKYAIDREMISQAMRIVLGYLSGLALAGVAIKLKNKYQAYSAVLMGGGLAVLYFVTFIAYSFYHLLPHIPAFALMLVCTAAAIYAALVYNRVVIAHLGQLGAYCIPFLLSNNTGQYAILFTYIAIINTGIMVLSFKKYWKSLFYAAFIMTWLIYLSWFLFVFKWPQQTTLAWIFLSVYFTIFYTTFLSYKLLRKEQFAISNVTVLLSNCFAFYGIGYGILAHSAHPDRYAGLYTIINAAIHLVVSQVLRRLQVADRNLYNLVLGLVVVFCTIAVPVQFDGNWVTLLWTAEAVLVFFIGRSRQAAAYEKLAAGLAILGFASLMQEWIVRATDMAVRGAAEHAPFYNMIFVSGLLVLLAYGAIIYISRSNKYNTALQPGSVFRTFYEYGLPIMFLGSGYFVFAQEISGFFAKYPAWQPFAFTTQLSYAMVFTGMIIFFNLRWLRNTTLATFSLSVIVLLVFLLLVHGLTEVNALATSYFNDSHGTTVWHLVMRYLVFAITAAMLMGGYKTVQAFVHEPTLRNGWPLLVHTVVLGMLSSEYLLWTTVSGAGNQFKLGLSIVWGVYALFLIVSGIRQKQKHLRLAAIVLFVITLIKLFFYDLEGAGTLTKTISFISLGVILLLVSFLYNKYKDVLFGNDD